jgi:hypothetical protein
MTSATRSTLLAALPPVLAALPAIVLLALSRDQLPDPVPLFFDLVRGADGFAGRWVAVLVDVALAVLFAAVFGTVTRAVGREPAGTAVGPSSTITASWAVAGGLGPLLLAAAAAGLDRIIPDNAVLPSWTLPVAVTGAVLAGLAGHRLAPDARRPPVSAGQRLALAGTAVLGLAVVVVLVTHAGATGPVAAAVTATVALGVLLALRVAAPSSVRDRTGRNGTRQR